MYIAECKVRGEDPVLTGKGNSVKLYRESFAESFVVGINERLYFMRINSGVNSTGELVLVNRKENVDEAFYNAFPNLRPKPAGTGVATTGRQRYRKWVAPKRSALGEAAGRRAAEDANLDPRGTSKKFL